MLFRIISGVKELPVTKTFMEYTEYDLYSSEQVSVAVPSRDPLQIDFKKLDWWMAPTFLGFPTEFKFYDAQVDDAGKEIAGTRTNYSKNYQVAEAVMSLDEYKARELPRIAEMKGEKLSRFHAFTHEFLDGGFSLSKSFKAAIGSKKPVMDWYIEQVESTIRQAEQAGATHIAIWDKKSATAPIIIEADMIVLDRKLGQLYPAAAKPAPKTPQP